MNEKIYQMINQQVFPTAFCPGCGHGILMNAILRAIAELEMEMKDMLFVSGIGCAAWIPSPHFKADTLHTLHGRAIAYATGAKLYNPKLKVMIVSGDGDLSAIGGNHLIHASASEHGYDRGMRKQRDLRDDGRAGGFDHAPWVPDFHDAEGEPGAAF